MGSGRLTRMAIRTLDAIAPQRKKAGHLVTGEQGEEEAYFYLRRSGYVIVARNFRSPRRRGEIDLIGWEGDVLCFIEVKTRTSRAVMPAEAAVDEAKQRELVAVAREYLRPLAGKPAARFDILSIYLDRGGCSPQITLFRNAFSMQ
ncbi:MAG TPA: YraN family protein [Terriglobales bacterium]|nr:YraN family protein [Terriglobales bacterium]